jgi:hypothetical protein
VEAELDELFSDGFDESTLEELFGSYSLELHVNFKSRKRNKNLDK